VLSRIGGFKNIGQHQGYLSNKDPKEEAAKKDISDVEESTQLNPEELGKLKAFLQTFQDEASCSLVHQGNLLSFESFTASKTDKNSIWILDSGAIDHITPNIQFFETYEALEPTKQITIADGTTIPIVGKGKVSSIFWLLLNQVLHVPSLTTTLISITQLTNDLNCFAVFSPHMCKLQDKGMGKTIGVARVHNGLYILDGKGEGSIRKQHSLAYSSSQSTSNISTIWLHHFRLGYPSFIVLKQMFSSFFNSLDPSNFQCDE